MEAAIPPLKKQINRKKRIVQGYNMLVTSLCCKQKNHRRNYFESSGKNLASLLKEFSNLKVLIIGTDQEYQQILPMLVPQQHHISLVSNRHELLKTVHESFDCVVISTTFNKVGLHITTKMFACRDKKPLMILFAEEPCVEMKSLGFDMAFSTFN